jgi:hypothetical protein
MLSLPLSRSPSPHGPPHFARPIAPLGTTRAVVLACVAILCAACTPRDAKAPPLAESVTFVKAAPRVGRVSIEESTVEFRLDSEATADGGATNLIGTESLDRERRREEILAAFDRIVTKKRVTFEDLERKETRNGLPLAQPKSLLAGRSYVAELTQSVPVFTRADGAPVSDAESRELKRRLSTFGKADPFLEGLPEGPVSPGSAASGMAGGFLEMFEANEANADGPDIGNVVVHFAGVRQDPQGRCGVFAFTMRIQMAGEPRVRLDLKGEFLVRISDGAPIRLEARGPARLFGLERVLGVDVRLRGKGEMSSTVRFTYL